MNKHKSRFWILFVVALFLIGLATYQGYTILLFGPDSLYLAWLVVAPFGVGLWAAYKKLWYRVEDAEGLCFTLGLIGTLIGIALMFTNLEGDASVTMQDLGGFTAVYTTIVGVVAGTWLKVTCMVLERYE